jgi:hypothetical protein
LEPRQVRSLLVTGAVVCALLVANVLTPLVLDPRHEWLQAIMVGICVGQLNLIATWAALAPGNIMVRLPWSLLLTVWMWQALVVGNRLSFSGFPRAEAILLGVVLLFGLFVAMAPLAIAARFFRWRLLGWEIAMDDELYLILPVVAFCNVVVTIPCIWGAFVSPRRLPLLAAGWFAYCALLTGAEIGFFVLFLGAPSSNELLDIFFLFYLMNLMQCLTVFGVLVIFRGLGFRLVRANS